MLVFVRMGTQFFTSEIILAVSVFIVKNSKLVSFSVVVVYYCIIFLFELFKI